MKLSMVVVVIYMNLFLCLCNMVHAGVGTYRICLTLCPFILLVLRCVFFIFLELSLIFVVVIEVGSCLRCCSNLALHFISIVILLFAAEFIRIFSLQVKVFMIIRNFYESVCRSFMKIVTIF